MSVSAVSSPGFAAIGAGLRGEIKARQFSQALASFGLLDESLAKALQALEDQARAVRQGGVARLQADQLGVLFDALA